MLRMDRMAFNRFCQLLISVGGLKNSRNVIAREKVTMFLYILDHHTKNRAIKFQFKRSGQTVSKYFHGVLQSVLKLHSLFFVELEPILEDSTDPRWGKFKGCIGALDGTYIDVLVPIRDKGRYKNHKGHISVNVLGVYDTNMRFVYMFSLVGRGLLWIQGFCGMLSIVPMAYEYLEVLIMDGFGNIGGWKADNGFKADFQRELEKGMQKILLGTDISAIPHINSKMHVWKKEYGLLTDAEH
ncbi:hypothetical protein ACS0TY_023735 [Phlomoides rotata]